MELRWLVNGRAGGRPITRRNYYSRVVIGTGVSSLLLETVLCCDVLCCIVFFCLVCSRGMLLYCDVFADVGGGKGVIVVRE